MRLGLALFLLLAGALPAAAAGVDRLLPEPAPLVLKDGRIARVSVYAVRFPVGSGELDAETGKALDKLIGDEATDCFLTAQAIGHAEPPASGQDDTLAAHRLARARADAVRKAMIDHGLPAMSIASVWDWQFVVKQPRVTLWIFDLPEGSDCKGTPLGHQPTQAMAAPEATGPAASARSSAQPSPTESAETAPAASSPTAAAAEPPPAPTAEEPAQPASDTPTEASSPPPMGPEPPSTQASQPPSPPSEPTPASPPATPPTTPPTTMTAAPEQATTEAAPPAANESAGQAAAVETAPGETATTPDSGVAQKEPAESTASSPAPAPAPAKPEASDSEAAQAAPPAAAPAAAEAGASTAAETTDVPFEVNSSFLSKAAVQKLRELAQGLRDGGHFTVELAASVGGVVKDASNRQAERYNRWMAERRIGRVTDWLREHAGDAQLEFKSSLVEEDGTPRVQVRLEPAG